MELDLFLSHDSYVIRSPTPNELLSVIEREASEKTGLGDCEDGTAKVGSQWENLQIKIFNFGIVRVISFHRYRRLMEA